MMQSASFHDAASVTAHAFIAEAQMGRLTTLSTIGHLLVRCGKWLQAITTQPATMEETVQWKSQNA